MIVHAEIKNCYKKNVEIIKTQNKLWPHDNSPLKISPTFCVDKYYFCVATKNNQDEIEIIINDLEAIELHFTYKDDDQGIYFYESKKIAARKFLGFNLGVYQLCLRCDDGEYPLRTVENTDAKIQLKELANMYETVAKSDFFNLFISNYSRANALGKETSGNSKHFWLSISIAKELIKEVKLFITGDLSLTDRVHKISEIEKYNTLSIIEGNDINWLLHHPGELRASNNGLIYVNGARFDVEYMSQSRMVSSYDTYENRLVLTSLFSIKSILSEICEDYKASKYFPHSALHEIISQAVELTSKLNVILKLTPPFDTYPQYSNKYLGDTRYIKLYDLISRWYSVNNIDIGHEIRSPTFEITAVFEHFCFVKLVESILRFGFVLDDQSLKDVDQVGSVIMKKGEQKIVIYYELQIPTKYTIDDPLHCSKDNKVGYLPDFIITYEYLGYVKCGVIDPKFTDKKSINKLAEHIHYKYGLFLHRKDLAPLDYVLAMYPESNSDVKVNNSRVNDLPTEISPFLGYFSVPLDSTPSETLTNFIEKLVTSSAPPKVLVQT